MGCTSPHWQPPKYSNLPLPRDPLATCPNSLQPLPEVNPVAFLHLQSRILKCAKPLSVSLFPLCEALYLFVSFLPPYGFLLFSLLVVFLLQECPISLIPGVVQVLCYQAVVGSQPILLNILEKTESFLLFGAHHSSSVSTAF